MSRHILIRLHTDEGVTGVAECAGGDVAEATLAVVQHYLGPAVIGLDPREMDLLHRRMDAASPHQYRAKNGIDQAAYDVAGKAAGLSVAELMGGRYRDAVPVCDVIGIGPPEEVADAARDVLDRGFRQVKLKAGRDFQRDLQTVEAVRTACGDALQIRLDINSGYQSAAVALPLCKRLEAAGVDIFEQPVEPSDLAGMALVAKELDAPVLAHESLFTIRDAMAIIAMKAADILNISPPRAGGLYPALQMVRWAELKNVPVIIAGAMEAGLGNIASASLGAACRTQPYPGDARTVLRESETLVNEPIRIEAGHVHLPGGPGFGLTLDEDAIARCQVTPWLEVKG